MIIAVEGMDGTGKTTVCKYVSKKYDYIMIDKPTKYLFEDTEGNIDKKLYYKTLEKIYLSNPYIRTTFFAMGNIIATNKYKNSNLVLDRHLVSNYFWNSDNFSDYIYDLIIEKCGKPDLTILLYATPETRYNRLLKRNQEDVDLFDESVFQDGQQKMVEFLEKYKLNYTIINTEYLSIEEVFVEIDKIINYLEVQRRKNND